MSHLHFESSGSGRPVIALHGYGASLFSWRDLPAALPDRRVIRIDLPAHGGSSARTDGRYGLKDYAQLIIDFVEERGLETFDLVGHSMGGGVALMIAIDLLDRRPGAVNSLTLLDSIALPQRLPYFIALARTPGVGPFLLSQLPARCMASAVLRAAFHNRGRITEDITRVYTQNLSTKERRRGLLLTAQQMIPSDLPRLIENYRRLTMPTLLIWGQQDKIVPPAIGIALNALILGSRLILIDDCGHIPHEERPDATLPVIADFLSRVSPIAR